jgi:hypothetical protein
MPNSPRETARRFFPSLGFISDAIEILKKKESKKSLCE